MAENDLTVGLGRKLLEEFEHAEKMRKSIEENWVRDARQYHGQYEPDVLSRIKRDPRTGKPLKSDVFIRHTKSKCDVLKARIMDLLFPSNNARNWNVAPSPDPEVPDMVLMQEIREREERNEHVPSDMKLLAREVAEKRARAMCTLIDDQLNNSKISYKRTCNKVLRSGLIYGTGILKGPLVEYRPKEKYVFNSAENVWAVQRSEEDTLNPYFEFVPVFDVYPDPGAIEPENLRYVWQSHVMTRPELLDLSKNPGFHGEIIRAYVLEHPDGDMQMKEHETELRSISVEQLPTSEDTKDRYRVLERWGYLTGQELLDAGMPIEQLIAIYPDFDEAMPYESSVWLMETGTVIKASLSPVEGMAIPYHFFQPYQSDTGFWSEGMPDIIRDQQTVINASARMTLDNAAIACGPQFVVNADALSNNEDAEQVYPGKIWWVDSAADLDKVFRVVNIQSHIGELMTIGEKHAQFSDEVSIPRYMSGDNSGVRGAGDTASGLSMLMGMASMPVKDIVINFDQGITEPFIKAMYRWNMRHSPREDVKGDYEVIATGSTSLIAQELMGKRLMEVMNVLGVQPISEQTNFDVLFTHILRAMDLPSDIKLTPEQAEFRKKQAMQMEKEAQLQAVIAEAEKRGLPIAGVLQQLGEQVLGMKPQGDIQPSPGQTAMAENVVPTEGGGNYAAPSV